jgi:hypothetical protein
MRSSLSTISLSSLASSLTPARMRTQQLEATARANAVPLQPLDSFEHVIWAGDLNFRVNAPRPVFDLLLQKVRMVCTLQPECEESIAIHM